MITYRWDNFQKNILNSLHTMLDLEDFAKESQFANVTILTNDGKVRAHQFVLAAASPYFRDIFQDFSKWQEPVIILKHFSISVIKHVIEFVYKGSVQMRENLIESFLDAGKYLNIEGIVGDTSEVHLSDQEEVVDRNGILNSTRTYDDIETLRDAPQVNHSFNLDLSNISQDRSRSILRDLTVDIRRLSKEDARQFSFDNLDLIRNDMNKSRRSSRLSSSYVNYCEDDAPLYQNSTFNKTKSGETSKSRVSVSSNEMDSDEVAILDTSPSLSKSRRSKANISFNSSSNTSTSNSKRKSKSSESSARVDCFVCEESIAEMEWSTHFNTFHKRKPRQSSTSDMSTSSNTSGRKSITNLGSTYRTKPMESSRSIRAKSLSTKRALYPSEPFNRSEPHVQRNKKKSHERMQMLQSLNGNNDTHSNDQNVNLNGVEANNQNVNLNGVEANNQLNHESMMISDSSLGSTNLETSQLVSNETEHQPEVGNTSTNVFLNEQEMMESEEIVPSADTDVAEKASHEDIGEFSMNSMPPLENNSILETKENVIQNQAKIDVAPFLVIIDGRSMCKFCGMQVQDKNAEEHFMNRHKDLI